MTRLRGQELAWQRLYSEGCVRAEATRHPNATGAPGTKIRVQVLGLHPWRKDHAIELRCTP
jgi:hypothetical protein